MSSSSRYWPESATCALGKAARAAASARSRSGAITSAPTVRTKSVIPRAATVGGEERCEQAGAASIGTRRRQGLGAQRLGRQEALGGRVARCRLQDLAGRDRPEQGRLVAQAVDERQHGGERLGVIEPRVRPVRFEQQLDGRDADTVRLELGGALSHRVVRRQVGEGVALHPQSRQSGERRHGGAGVENQNRRPVTRCRPGEGAARPSARRSTRRSGSSPGLPWESASRQG